MPSNGRTISSTWIGKRTRDLKIIWWGISCDAFRSCQAEQSSTLYEVWDGSVVKFTKVTPQKSPQKWQKFNLVAGDRLGGQWHGLAMNWVEWPCTSADERMLSGCRAVVIVWWAVAGFGRFSLTSRFSWTVTLNILGLGFMRARLLRLCSTASFPPIFLQLRKGPLWRCAELLQSGAICCLDQWGTVKPLASAQDAWHGPRTVLGYVGKRGWGVEGYWCLRKWVQWSPSIGGAKCDWLCQTKETCRASFVSISSLRGRCRTVVPGVLVCVRMYILCVCVYSISASACGRCHACACVFVCICVRMHVCVSIYICAFYCSECCMHFGTGFLGTSAWAGVYVTQVWFYTNVHICEHTRCRLCTYVYIYIFLYIHLIFLFMLATSHHGDTFSFNFLNSSPYWLCDQILKRKCYGVMGWHLLSLSLTSIRVQEKSHAWKFSVRPVHIFSSGNAPSGRALYDLFSSRSQTSPLKEYRLDHIYTDETSKTLISLQLNFGNLRGWDIIVSIRI